MVWNFVLTCTMYMYIYHKISGMQYTRRPQELVDFNSSCPPTLVRCHQIVFVGGDQWNGVFIHSIIVLPGTSTFPPQNWPQSPVLSENCMLFTSRQDRDSLQQSLYFKNSREQRYTERQNSRCGPPKNHTKIKVCVESAKGEYRSLSNITYDLI